MAKVTITISDSKKGVNLKIESNPPFPNPENPKEKDKKITNAQSVAAQLFSAIVEDLKEQQGES